MNEFTDQQLLRDYAERRSEPAFTELVRRHVDLVYSAALRMVCDAELAKDVTQNTFIALAQNAPQLTARAVLSGWLHRTAQNLAAKVVRTDVRRRAREQEAAAMNELLSAESDPTWEQIAPHLDTALGELNDADRDALMLRYFERKSAREMAQKLGISDEAAQKRVNRAVEHLRELFAKRGVAVGTSALVAVVSANAVQAAPAGLTVTISAAAVLTSTAVPSTAIVATKTIAMTTLQKAILGTALVAATATGIYEARQTALLREQNQILQQQQTPLVEQIQQLQRERDEATNRLARLTENSETAGRDRTELLRLRNEVARMRESAHAASASGAASTTSGSDPTMDAALKVWSARAAHVRNRLELMPEKKIPEIQLLAQQGWFDAVKELSSLETEADYRQAFSNLRDQAKKEFGRQLQEALRKYVKDHAEQTPGDLAQLQSYFAKPMDEAILQRYALLRDGEAHGERGETYVVGETAAPVDDEYDTRVRFGLNGTYMRSINQTEDAIRQAGIAFANANNGLLPKEAAQLSSFLSTPIDPGRVQAMLDKIPTGITTLEQLRAAGLLPK